VPACSFWCARSTVPSTLPGLIRKACRSFRSTISPCFSDRLFSHRFRSLWDCPSLLMRDIDPDEQKTLVRRNFGVLVGLILATAALDGVAPSARLPCGDGDFSWAALIVAIVEILPASLDRRPDKEEKDSSASSTAFSSSSCLSFSMSWGGEHALSAVRSSNYSYPLRGVVLLISVWRHDLCRPCLVSTLFHLPTQKHSIAKRFGVFICIFAEQARDAGVRL